MKKVEVRIEMEHLEKTERRRRQRRIDKTWYAASDEELSKIVWTENLLAHCGYYAERDRLAEEWANKRGFAEVCSSLSKKLDAISHPNNHHPAERFLRDASGVFTEHYRYVRRLEEAFRRKWSRVLGELLKTEDGKLLAEQKHGWTIRSTAEPLDLGKVAELAPYYSVHVPEIGARR
jgi:hypothetical protein